VVTNAFTWFNMLDSAPNPQVSYNSCMEASFIIYDWSSGNFQIDIP